MLRHRSQWVMGVAFTLVASLSLSLYADETPPFTEQRQAALEALLPDDEPMGLQRDGEPVFYTDDLFMYINGAAGAYHDLSFAALAHLYYMKDDVEIALDIYDMDESIHAFGIFAAERSDGVEVLDIGADGYLAGSILNFYQGPYYVKLSAWSTEDEVIELMKGLAAAVSERIATQISEGLTVPGLLRWLPQDGLVDYSIRYNKKSPMGYDHLAPALSASYAWSADDEEEVDEESVSQLLLSVTPDHESARERIAELRVRLSERGDIEDFALAGEGGFKAQDRYRGAMIGFAIDSWAVILSNPPEDPSDWIESITLSLRDEQSE